VLTGRNPIGEGLPFVPHQLSAGEASDGYDHSIFSASDFMLIMRERRFKPISTPLGGKLGSSFLLSAPDLLQML
jgi:hypothetical protein